jgi:hypothetical protein
MFKFFAGVSAGAAAAALGMAVLLNAAVTAGEPGKRVPVITGEWVNSWGQEIAINARIMPSGQAEGSVTVVNDGTVSLVVDINAVYRDENVAYASGTISFSENPIEVGCFLLFRVTDNGEGKNAPTDSATAFWEAYSADEALDPVWRDWLDEATEELDELLKEWGMELTIVSGNLRVHNR